MANNITKVLKNIQQNILSSKYIDVDKKLESAISSIRSYESEINSNKYIDYMKGLAQNISNKDGSYEEIANMLTRFTQNPEYFDQKARIARYNEYEAITANITYCKRAIQVLTDNTISPDDISKQTVQISPDEGKDKDKEIKETISNLINIKKELGIEKHIHQWVKNTFKFGDNFIELLYSPDGQNATTILNENKNDDQDIFNESSDQQLNDDAFTNSVNILSEEYLPSLLTNNQNQIKELDTFIIEGFKDEKSVNKVILSEYSQSAFSLGYTNSNTGFGSYNNTHASFQASKRNVSPNHSNIDKTDDKFKGKYTQTDIPDIDKKVNIKNIFVVSHDPRYVIKLESTRFKLCMGYLVFPKVANSTFPMAQTLNNSQVNTIDDICIRIMDIVSKNIQTNYKWSKDDLNDVDDDLKNYLKDYLKLLKSNEDLNIRYVPPNLMSHWKLYSDKYSPYGESVLDGIIFDAKLYQALKTANTIKQLTSSTDKRFIYVETGLRRDAKNYIDNIKETMRNRKISIDKFGSIDSIPSHIATFEDIYIPMKDGKRFVEIEDRPFGQQPSNDVENLKFIRDNLIAGMEIPPAFLSVEENTHNKSLLTNESSNFVRTIIGYQNQFSHLLKDLFSKLYKINNLPDKFKNLKYIHVTFPAPKTSLFEYKASYLQQMTGIIESMKMLGVNDKYLIKKFLPDYNWEEIEHNKADSKIDDLINIKSEDEQNAAPMMGGGPMMNQGMM